MVFGFDSAMRFTSKSGIYLILVSKPSESSDDLFMKPLKLEDIVPSPAEFKLARTDRTYKLRPLSLDDEMWLQATFGNNLQEVFDKVQMMEICRIAYHQMEIEDKESLRAQDVMLQDEEGNSEKAKIGGVKLLFALIAGTSEKLEVMKAILQTIGISRPMIDELTREELQKKNQMLNEQVSRQIGPESSTNSQPPMDGRPNT